MKKFMLFTKLYSCVSVTVHSLLRSESMSRLRNLFSGQARGCDHTPQRGGRIFAALFLLGFGLQASTVWAATFYVDPAAGSDSNSGSSQNSAWRTIPGTRTKSDGGFLRSSWGSISSGNRISAGDTIFLKAGASHTSANGGRLVIDSTFYNNGTSGSRIKILVSPSWGSGNFTIDGSGISIPKYFGFVFTKINHLTLSGASASRRLVIRDGSVSEGYNVLIYGKSGAHTTGVRLEYADILNGPLANIGVGYSDNGVIRNSLVHNASQSGIQLGLAADIPNYGWLLEDLDVYDNGLTTSGMENLPHGLQIVGSFDVTIRRVKSHGNRRDGFDFGTAAYNNGGSMSAVVIDSASYSNGEDGFGVNGGSGSVVVNYINVVSFNNSVSGWQIYDGPDIGIYHSVAHSNGTNSSFGGNILTYTDGGYPRPRITLRNNIFYKPKAFAQIGSYNSPGGNPIIDRDYNIYVPRSSNSEIGFDFPWGTQKNYSNPPSFIGPNDKLGVNYNPGFVSSASKTSFNANDYHLSDGNSTAVSAGVVLTGVALTDKDRDSKARGTSPDIGAYEFGSSSALAAPSPPSNVTVQ